MMYVLLPCRTPGEPALNGAACFPDLIPEPPASTPTILLCHLKRMKRPIALDPPPTQATR